jgi:hypothetical protein
LESLYPGLVELRQNEQAYSLLLLVAALEVAWPGSDSKAELNYTHFWDEVGFRLPEWAKRYINFQQQVHKWEAVSVQPLLASILFVRLQSELRHMCLLGYT